MPPARDHIRFVLNGEMIETAAVGGAETLLDFLRIRRRLTGSKEGCAEGDCGACTVLVGRISDGGLRYETVNACIRFLASVDRCHVVTVEQLSGPGEALHPVQQAMVDHHGSQCGFCTPGIVMSLYALWMENPSPSEDDIETALQGNLCRCTGYEPIIRAAQAAAAVEARGDDPLSREREVVGKRLAALDDGLRVEIGDAHDRAILPADEDDLARVLATHPDATIIAGATDVGLWVTKFLRPISPAVFIGHLDSLRRIDEGDEQIRIGAAASYSDCEGALGRAFPHLPAFWRRIGGWQVRNMGTVGGNIANGSPIGDTPPVLIALGAEVVLRNSDGRRVLPLEDFFVAYGEQDLAPGEFVEEILVPRAKGGLHAAYKISKRRDEDISSVCAAFNISVGDGRIGAARIAFGGMAGTPKRATQAEQALVGVTWGEAAFVEAAAQLDKDFTPLSDWRASAGYRLQVARALFRRFYLEHSDQPAPVRLQRA